MHTLPRHQCIIYDGSPTLHMQSLALTIIGKLKSNKRCLYLHSPDMVASMHTVLDAAGCDVAAEIEKGALILTSSQSHLVDGNFDVDRMMAMLAAAMQSALASGYVGLWATGDMTWELGEEKDFTKLFDYERRLQEFMQNNPGLSGVCQYHRDTMPHRAIKIAIHTHPSMYINNTLSRINQDYQPNAA